MRLAQARIGAKRAKKGFDGQQLTCDPCSVSFGRYNNLLRAKICPGWGAGPEVRRCFGETERRSYSRHELITGVTAKLILVQPILDFLALTPGSGASEAILGIGIIEPAVLSLALSMDELGATVMAEWLRAIVSQADRGDVSSDGR
jgi:hypothetical protein